MGSQSQTRLSDFTFTLKLIASQYIVWASQVALMVKNRTANAGDPGSIPGSGSSLEKEKRQPTPVLLPRKSHARRSLVSMGSQRVGHN